MTTEPTRLDNFLTADYETQFELLKDSATRAEVETWMGSESLRELLRHGPGRPHLAGSPRNIIFVPGVMGSVLLSQGLGGVWWLDAIRARDKLDQLRLTEDGTADVDPNADVRAGAVDVSYVPFRQAMAVSRDFGGSVPFPYDWRKALRASTDGLRDTILKTHHESGKRVHLIGHSMGGLLIRAALMVYGTELWPHVDRIVFVATPHYGATAIAGYLKNHLWGWEAIAIVGMFLSRKTFRSLRGVLSLLPAPIGVYPGTRNGEVHPCANFDLYDARAWQLDLDAAETVQLQETLDEVRKFYTDLYSWHRSLLKEYKDCMLVIAGVGQETLFRLEFDTLFWGQWEKTKKITKRRPCELDREGDGSVPLASAALEDVEIRYVTGEHGSLPNIPAVAVDALGWLQGDRLRLAQTCKGALAGHLSADETSSSAPSLDGSGKRGQLRELPEYENPTAQFRAKIAAELDAGRMPQVNLAKIL